jgi:DNA-binding GntR family transcriptional regulator
MSASAGEHGEGRGRVADPLGAVLDELTEARRRRRAVMSTSADRAARTIREQVVDGHLRSGTRLPEERLGAALGVSRNTLREALSQLVAERILVREPNRGVVVATPGADDVADVYAVRLLIEPAALQHGRSAGGDAPAPTHRELAPLAEAVGEGVRAREADDWEAVATANQHFHRAVVGLAGSPRLDAQMDLLLAEMRLFFHQMDDRADGLADFHRPYLDENAAITDLLAAGEVDAAADRLRSYLRAARDQLLAALRSPTR